jgi:hypothetical protein
VRRVGEDRCARCVANPMLGQPCIGFPCSNCKAVSVKCIRALDEEMPKEYGVMTTLDLKNSMEDIIQPWAAPDYE